MTDLQAPTLLMLLVKIVEEGKLGKAHGDTAQPWVLESSFLPMPLPQPQIVFSYFFDYIFRLWLNKS